MRKKLILWVFLCFGICLGVIALLVASSKDLQKRPGSFLRVFPPHPIAEIDTLDTKSHSSYIAGGSSSKLYLASHLNPLRLLVIEMPSLDTQNIKLHIAGIFDQKFWSPNILVDSPNFYLYDGTIPVIYQGDIDKWTGQKHMSDSIYFQSIVSMHEGSFAVKSLSGSTGENILGKITEWMPYRFFTDKILQKQIDGVFCTDGMLRYDNIYGRLIYVYYYRNEFMVMDSSLNLIYRAQTIDTTSIAKIKVATIESSQWKTLSSPANFVNKQVDVMGNWLFIQSNLIARNEHPEAFKKGAVIDMYNLVTQRYVFSFYLYNFDGQLKMNEFRVFGDRLIARFDNMLVIYRLKPEYFSEITKQVNAP